MVRMADDCVRWYSIWVTEKDKLAQCSSSNSARKQVFKR